MEIKFADITAITSPIVYKKVKLYLNSLINEATKCGALDDPEADNVYTREIGRVGVMCADYESMCYKAKAIVFKNPLIESIEKEMKARSLKQRQTADLLDIKESTFSQIMTGRRPVSMRLAKRLYEKLGIDPGLILRFA